jgi:putative hydrolase of the HAD superfamily
VEQPAPELRAVLFDGTGTLISTREDVGETYARLARDWGVELPAWRLGDAFGRILRSSPPRVFPAAGSRDETEAEERRWWRQLVRGTFLAADNTAGFRDFDGFFAALFEHYAGGHAWALARGAEAVLTELRGMGLATGVISNFDFRLHNILKDLGIHDLLDVVMLPVDCGFAKPDRRIFRQALARLELPAPAALYVGDDPEADIAAARAAGLLALDVTTLAELSELPTRLTRPATLPAPGAPLDARNT